jgi:hypothetical protein
VKAVDPRTVVENHQAILTSEGAWPNFHDAEVIDLYISRGDVRPDDDGYIFPHITLRVRLCAVEHPFVVTLKFKGCSSISLQGFNHQNPILNLQFAVEERGLLNNSEPMTPYIVVMFEQISEFALSFKCFHASVVNVAQTYPAKR